MWIAWLSCRLPCGLRRCRTFGPDEASIGAVALPRRARESRATPQLCWRWFPNGCDYCGERFCGHSRLVQRGVRTLKPTSVVRTPRRRLPRRNPLKLRSARHNRTAVTFRQQPFRRTISSTVSAAASRPRGRPPGMRLPGSCSVCWVTGRCGEPPIYGVARLGTDQHLSRPGAPALTPIATFSRVAVHQIQIVEAGCGVCAICESAPRGGDYFGIVPSDSGRHGTMFGRGVAARAAAERRCITEPLAWMRDALCQEHLTVEFFPARGESRDPSLKPLLRVVGSRQPNRRTVHFWD